MRYSLLKEIEAIIKKTIGIEEELKSLLNKIRGIKYAFLFGSYVKGGIKSSSDIDLFIVGGAADDLVYNSIRQVENIVERDINYHLATEKEFIRALRKQSFMKEITKKYILLIGEAHGFRKLIKRSN
jgi:predicted nucleotidyltransferase